MNSSDRGLIRITMSNTRPVEIQYPTEVIQTPLEDREELVVLPSGVDVIDRLTEAGYLFNDIQAVRVGYGWTSSEESSRIAELTPAWYVKMNDTWRTVDAWLKSLEEGENVGL